MKGLRWIREVFEYINLCIYEPAISEPLCVFSNFLKNFQIPVKISSMYSSKSQNDSKETTILDNTHFLCKLLFIWGKRAIIIFV